MQKKIVKFLTGYKLTVNGYNVCSFHMHPVEFVTCFFLPLHHIILRSCKMQYMYFYICHSLLFI